MTKKDVVFANQHVIPYNPYLLQKFDFHLNYEMCNSMKVIKYLHKHVYKGLWLR